MKRSALLLAALVVASLAVFWPTLGAGFITDDFPIVVGSIMKHSTPLRKTN